MFGVLSKLAIALAVVCGPLLSGWCSAQSTSPRKPVRRAAAWQPAAEDEQVPPSPIAEPVDGDSYPGGSEFVGEFGEVLEGDQFPYTSESLDSDMESLIPDGLWNNRGPLWLSLIHI